MKNLLNIESIWTMFRAKYTPKNNSPEYSYTPKGKQKEIIARTHSHAQRTPEIGRKRIGQVTHLSV